MAHYEENYITIISYQKQGLTLTKYKKKLEYIFLIKCTLNWNQIKSKRQDVSLWVSFTWSFRYKSLREGVGGNDLKGTDRQTEGGQSISL